MDNAVTTPCEGSATDIGQLRRRPSTLAAMLGLLVALCGSLVAADDLSPEPVGHRPVQLGWNGAYFVGRWTPIAIVLSKPSDGKCLLNVTAADPDGHRVTWTSAVEATAEPKRPLLRGRFKLGQFDFAASRTKPIDPDIQLTVTADSSNEPLTEWKASAQGDHAVRPPLAPGTRLVVTVGKPTGFANSAVSTEKSPTTGTQARVTEAVHIAEVEIDQLPIDAIDFDGVSLVVLSGSRVASPDQSQALRDWTSRGGHLLLSLPAQPEGMRAVIDSFSEWLPLQFGDEPVIVREFSSLEAYSGRNVRVPFSERLSIPRMKFEHGVVLAGGRDDPLLVRVPYGLGSVTVLALDLTQPPLSKWKEVNALGNRLLSDITSAEDLGDSRTAKQAQLSSIGVTDLATQLHAIQDHFDGIARVSPWFAMGVLALLAIAIGPVDYLIVHRLLRRPRATWVTFPVWVALAALFATQLASRWNGTTLRANQFQLLTIDGATGSYRSRLWTNLYSPVTTHFESIEAAPKIKSAADGKTAERVQMGWAGVPESTFGGMYRAGGVEIGRSRYSQTTPDRLISVPMMQWSSKEIQTESFGSASQLVESDLTSSGLGKLTGTLTQRLGDNLEDWILVYGNRVYRHSKQRDAAETVPLPSGRVWRVEQPNVFQRELRPFLTGQITVATRKDSSKYQDITFRQTIYDPLSLSTDSLARMLTFHDEAGGTKYTGLTNRLLADEDLSQLLRLGRAILLGRLNGSAAEFSVNGSKPEPTEKKADREATYVRLILPVKRLSDVTRPLDIVDPDRLPK